MMATAVRKVMIVEDDHTTRILLSSVLQMNGFPVDLRESAADALQAIDRFKPDAVILDLDLGDDGPSGSEVLRILREKDPELPIMIVTNYRSPLLVDQECADIPNDVPYLIKDDLSSAEAIVRTLTAIMDRTYKPEKAPIRHDLPSVTRTQATLLRQIASGLSNEEIAQQRNTSVRAVDRLVQRALKALGVDNTTASAGRVQAVRRYLNSGVVVRDE